MRGEHSIHRKSQKRSRLRSRQAILVLSSANWNWKMLFLPFESIRAFYKFEREINTWPKLASSNKNPRLRDLKVYFQFFVYSWYTINVTK